MDRGTSAPEQHYPLNTPAASQTAPPASREEWVLDERPPANAVDQEYANNPEPAPAVVERLCSECKRPL